MDEVLVAEDVRRAYGDTVALEGVSLSLSAGEVFALVGPNGAGKTTLVRALTGTTDAEGRVELFGRPPADVARERIGLLPQEFGPPDRLTARELLRYYADLYDDARPVGDVLDDVGLTDAADTYYENLSGGQRRRACVGTALVNDPDLLFLDEPTTGIDPAGRRDLWDLIEGLADEGVTVLVTTHYMEEAERLADRVGLLADGELVAVDDPRALVAEHGGEARLTVTGDLPADAASGLDYPASLREGRLTVRGVDPTAIGRVVEHLEASGAEYEELSWSEPSLEDAYLALTGQSIRGGDRAAAPEAPSDRDGRVPAGGER